MFTQEFQTLHILQTNSFKTLSLEFEFTDTNIFPLPSYRAAYGTFSDELQNITIRKSTVCDCLYEEHKNKPANPSGILIKVGEGYRYRQNGAP